MNINNSPLVSVFILCYNHEKYIEKAIDSVISQTYANIEVIIVDNCSSDGSSEIISGYAARDERIKFLPMAYNSLVSYASNLGIAECRGEYVCLLSGDDFFETEKIDAQLRFMQENGLDLSFTMINVVDDSSVIQEEHPVAEWFNKQGLCDSAAILSSYIAYANRTNAVTAMFKKSLTEKGLLFDNRLLQTQDYDMWIRILSKNAKAAVLERKLSCYRVLSDGANLSIGLSDEKKNRIDFEMLHVFGNFCSFSAELVSVVLKEAVTEENKLEKLYGFFEANGIDYGRFAVLKAQFEKLGSDCSVNTDSFAFFFKKYAEFGFAFSSKMEETERLKKELLQTNEELVLIKSTLNDIYNSRFWKAFGIFRWLKKLLTGERSR